MKDLIIIGASGFGREVLQIVKDINKAVMTWNIRGFLDDNLNALDDYECDYPFDTIVDVNYRDDMEITNVKVLDEYDW